MFANHPREYKLLDDTEGTCVLNRLKHMYINNVLPENALGTNRANMLV